MVLADAHLAAGDLEQGCATAMRALTAGELIRSGRCVHYLREFRKHLAQAGDATVVTEVHTRKTVFFLASSVLLRGSRAARTAQRSLLPPW
jgi:hypothetical protein